MSEHNAFERQLADEIEYEVGPPRNVDATAITRQAQTSSPHRRFTTMSSTIKFAAGASVLAVAGSALLLVARGPDDAVITPPGAEQPSATPAAQLGDKDPALAAEFFHGTSRVLSYVDFGEKTEVEDGLVLEELRGQVTEGVVETTDERVTGATEGTFNQDTHLQPPDWEQPAITQWGTERIENDGGAWECTWSGGEMQFMAQQRLYWCVGDGGNDGYAMRMMWTRNADGTIDVAGLAWEGVLPPLGLPSDPSDG